MCSVSLPFRAAKVGPEADMLHKGSRGKPCRTNFTDSKKQGAIEGPIRIPVHSPLFLISTLAFPSISSKSLKFQSVLFSIPTAPTKTSTNEKG